MWSNVNHVNSGRNISGLNNNLDGEAIVQTDKNLIAEQEAENIETSSYEAVVNNNLNNSNAVEHK